MSGKGHIGNPSDKSCGIKKAYIGNSADKSTKWIKAYIGDPDGKARLWFSSSEHGYVYVSSATLRDNAVTALSKEVLNFPAVEESGYFEAQLDSFVFFKDYYYAYDSRNLRIMRSKDATSGWTSVLTFTTSTAPTTTYGTSQSVPCSPHFKVIFTTKTHIFVVGRTQIEYSANGLTWSTASMSNMANTIFRNCLYSDENYVVVNSLYSESIASTSKYWKISIDDLLSGTTVTPTLIFSYAYKGGDLKGQYQEILANNSIVYLYDSSTNSSRSNIQLDMWDIDTGRQTKSLQVFTSSSSKPSVEGYTVIDGNMIYRLGALRLSVNISTNAVVAKVVGQALADGNTYSNFVDYDADAKEIYVLTPNSTNVTTVSIYNVNKTTMDDDTLQYTLPDYTAYQKGIHGGTFRLNCIYKTTL